MNAPRKVDSPTRGAPSDVTERLPPALSLSRRRPIKPRHHNPASATATPYGSYAPFPLCKFSNKDTGLRAEVTPYASPAPPFPSFSRKPSRSNQSPPTTLTQAVANHRRAA
ncbi:Hypothetical predicted protein [Podarcis lilfordi]|uniref:Uncharacterized protein n=1 Tax=Podarcis lilfordi TaxID=74358 RepID=A0AA35KXH0_9SAUR|nr:Hypothetical predicted protein [Podarcis lilfordi]